MSRFDAQQWGSPVYLEASAPVGQGRHSAYASHMAADQKILARTLSALTEADLDGSVEALAGARRVVVIGFRNSAWLAMYARPDWIAAPGRRVGTAAH